MSDPTVEIPALDRLIAGELDQPVAPAIQRLVDRIRGVGQDVLAILFYGAGLWKSPAEDTVFDFYVLTGSYRRFDDRRLHALFGYFLPPNVYYLEVDELRCKFAVIRFDQFRKGASGRGLTTQIWARFAQPCRLVYCRDNAVRELIIEALADAVVTFHAQTLPLLEPDEKRNADTIWTRGLSRTYANEWRSERGDRAASIVQASRDALEARSALILPGCRPARHPATRGLRRLLAKAVYFAQLMKAVFTFEGGVDYALWKIERQSGLKLQATDFQKRHPLIGAWPLVWRAWRRGGLR